jgi:hypothetical protein
MKYDFTRFRAWQAFKVHVAFEKGLFLIFAILFLKFFNFVITYWYVMIPLLLIGLVKFLSVAEQEVTKQQIAEQQKQYKREKIITRINEIVDVRFNDLTLEENEELLKKSEDLLAELKGTDEEYELRYELIPLRTCPQLFRDNIRYIKMNKRG